jgi:Domain of unknown function (DUF4395)
MGLRFGQSVSGAVVGGRELRAAVFDENQVRAAAGVTMVLGAVALSLAYFDQRYVPLQVVSTFFLVEFAVRLTAGIRYSPVGVVAGLMTRGRPPDWVSAKPKRFAWTMGLGLAFSMAIITNSGIRGWLPRSICVVCLTLMWMESVLGLCLGCRIHGLLVRRGWTSKDPEFEVCSDGSCEVPLRPEAAAAARVEG